MREDTHSCYMNNTRHPKPRPCGEESLCTDEHALILTTFSSPSPALAPYPVLLSLSISRALTRDSSALISDLLEGCPVRPRGSSHAPAARDPPAPPGLTAKGSPEVPNLPEYAPWGALRSREPEAELHSPNCCSPKSLTWPRGSPQPAHGRCSPAAPPRSPASPRLLPRLQGSDPWFTPPPPSSRWTPPLPISQVFPAVTKLLRGQTGGSQETQPGGLGSAPDRQTAAVRAISRPPGAEEGAGGATAAGRGRILPSGSSLPQERATARTSAASGGQAAASKLGSHLAKRG